MTSNEAQVSIMRQLRSGPVPYSTLKRQAIIDKHGKTSPQLDNDHRVYGPILDAIDYMLKTKKITRVVMAGTSHFRIAE